jgi:hypothetical protein
MNATHSAMPWGGGKFWVRKSADKADEIAAYHGIHQQPVPGEHPNAHDCNRHGEAQELGGGETSTTAQRHPMAIGARTDDVLTHRKEQKREGDGRDDCKSKKTC